MQHTGDEDTQLQLKELQRSVNEIAGDVHSVREAQTRSEEAHERSEKAFVQLHEDHYRLVTRLDGHERRFDVHLKDYERLQEQNELVHAHITGSNLAFRAELKDFRDEFKEHDKAEKLDRKEHIKALRGVILWVVGTGITVMFGLGALAVSVWQAAG